jgi:hypothetical protein
MNLPQRTGNAAQVKPWKWLDDPIFADGPRNPLNQFLAAGLHPLCLACRSLAVYHIHSNHILCLSILQLADLQNQTIIFDNYSTILRITVSIMPKGVNMRVAHQQG